MKKNLFILIILLIAELLSAQSKIDSLETLLPKYSGKEKVDLLYDLAWAYKYEKPQKGLEYAEQGLNIVKDLEYKEGEAKLRKAIGATYLTLGNYKLGLNNTKLSLKTYEELNNKQGVASTLNIIGIIYVSLSNYDKALEYYQKSLKIKEELGDKYGIANTLNNIGVIYNDLSDYDKALEYNFKSLKIAEEISNKQIIAYTLNNIGLIYSKLSNYDIALEYFHRSLKIAEEISSKQIIAKTLNNIGLVYSKLSNYDIALEFYHKSLKIKEEIGNKQGIASTLNNIGNEYQKLSKYDKALEYCFKSLKISEEIGNKEVIAATLNNIGEAYTELSKYDKALEYYHKSLTISEEIENKYLIVSTLNSIGDCYNNQQKYDLSLQYYERSLKQAKQINARESISENYKNYSEIYSAKKDYKKAFEYHKLYTVLKDSIFSQESAEKIAGMEKQFEIEKKEKEIQVFKNEKSIDQLKLSRQRLLIYLFVIILALILLAIIFILYRYRIKHKANLEIASKNKQLKILADQLQQMDQIKSNFFANISHEFRTPLTLIIGPLKKLLDNSKCPNLRTTFKLMLRNAQQQLMLVDQLLDLSKIEIKKMKLQVSLGSLNQFTKVMISSFQSLAEERNIQLNFIEEEKNIEIYFDQDKLHKIISNLISNAFKFTPHNGTISVIIGIIDTAGQTEERNYARLVVQDTGIGIPQEHIEHIFDRFYQVDSSATRRYEGTGIGLALTKELVELHQGEILVNSKTKNGTEFIVHLPLGKNHLTEDEIVDTSLGVKHSIYDFDDSSQQFVSDASHQQKPISKAAPLILIVEDNQDMRNYIGESLYGGYNLIEAEDGAIGFNQAIKHIPDLIISDVMMPGMNGFELTKKLKKDIHTSHIPVILLTAKAGEKSKIKGLETGADAYVNKPFSTKELLVRAKNLIEQRRKLRDKFEKNITIDPSEVTVTSVDENFLRKAAKIVEKHIDDTEFSVEQFSKEMLMDRNNLYRKLKKLVNQSSSQFIRTIRLKRATQLLKQKTAPINEIAFMVGFENPSYFSECFKKQFSVSPSEYGGE